MSQAKIGGCKIILNTKRHTMKEMHKENGKKYRRVRIKYFSNSYDIDIRPLSAEELQSLLLIGRNSGWYDNHKLFEYLLKCGLKFDKERTEIAKLDVSLIALIGREIWLATLESLNEKVNHLAVHVTRKKIASIKVKPYKFADLITPTLLYLITRDMEKLDVKKYVRAIIDYTIEAIKINGKIFTSEKKRDYIDKRFGHICRWLMEMDGIEDKIHRALPKNICNSVEERFFVALNVANTLDWQQYGHIINHFNVLVEKLILQSNQFGGVQISKPVFVTGIPSFIKLMRYPSLLPFKVILAIATDIIEKKKTRLSSHYDKVVKKYLQEALQQISFELQEIRQYNKAEIAIKVLNAFALKLRQKHLVYSACYLYWAQFRESIEDHIDKTIKDYLEKCALSNIPDGYLLVEGASDCICFEKFLTLLSKPDVVIKVLDCNNKNGVYAKYRDIIKNEPYIGAIVTVLDSDAETEHKMITKINNGSIYVEHFMHKWGTLEDLFPVSLHAMAINHISQAGEEITEKDLTNSCKPIVETIKKILWNKKKITFDKVAHAKNLCSFIDSTDKIPSTAMAITDKMIELAQRKVLLKARPVSIYTIDRLAEQINKVTYNRDGRTVNK